MINPDMSLKLRWVIFVVLGLHLIASPALADGPRIPHFSTSSLLNEEEFVFKTKDEELRLAENHSYSSTLKERTRRTRLRGKTKLDTNFFKGLFADTGYILKSHVNWDTSDWYTASAVAGTTVFFMAWDDEINEEVKEGRGRTTDDISSVFEPFGNSAIVFPALAGFYLYGRFGENEKMERTALLAAESFLVTSLFAGVLKVSVRRTRPFDGVSANTFDGSFTDNNAFPSGHTATAFAVATVVANEYEEVPMIAPICYGIAAMTGLSRINDQKHWAADVFFGAALGYFTSKTILRLHSNKKGHHFTIYPRTDSRGGGLVLSTRF